MFSLANNSRKINSYFIHNTRMEPYFQLLQQTKVKEHNHCRLWTYVYQPQINLQTICQVLATFFS